MNIVLFCHSLLSDWNHGNAHFLRGLVTELVARGHQVRSYEPRNAWSVENLLAERGPEALAEARRAYPAIDPVRYDLPSLDLEACVDGADCVLVHEWTDPSLVAALGRLRSRGARFRLLFHDTHHRSVSAPEQMAQYDLSGFDGVLAFGECIREIYVREGWARRVWTFHEAADVRRFRPPSDADDLGPERSPQLRDLVWIGNWGDDERTKELAEFLLSPIRELGLTATVHGVRWPDDARRALAEAGGEYRGWLPNYEVPTVFARHRVTVHVPRRPYARQLPGIPTIRPFEAMACAIPLVSAPWQDVEGLFSPGEDYLVARDGAQMSRYLRELLCDGARARSLAEHGLRTIHARHTCAHRVDELFGILRLLGHEAVDDLGVLPAVASSRAPERALGATLP